MNQGLLILTALRLHWFFLSQQLKTSADAQSVLPGIQHESFEASIRFFKTQVMCYIHSKCYLIGLVLISLLNVFLVTQNLCLCRSINVFGKPTLGILHQAAHYSNR